MRETTIEKLGEFGQSVWLDNINRSLIEGGKLNEMIGWGLRGVTSNPTIFDKAIRLSSDYDDKIRKLSRAGKSTFEIYDNLTIRDIQVAADIFKPVYEKTNGLDGYISLEVNPQLAFNAKETIEEGRRLHKKVNRPNVMFKVPSTEAGFQATEELLACGININVTLIFSVEQYIKTAGSFLKGMRRLLQDGGDACRVRSVASVFVSRVDATVDKMLEEQLADKQDEAVKNKVQFLKGKAAVANAKLIFHKCLEIFSSEDFKLLKEKGANPQRVLWGSTSTKNPNYSDIKYVSELIAKDTVNTMPEQTFDAFLDHGVIKEAMTANVKEAQDVIKNLKDLGIDINDICAKLLQDGVVAFEKSFESLLNSIEEKVACLHRGIK